MKRDAQGAWDRINGRRGARSAYLAFRLAIVHVLRQGREIIPILPSRMGAGAALVLVMICGCGPVAFAAQPSAGRPGWIVVAQATTAPRITVPPIVFAEAGRQAHLPVKVGPPGAVPKQTYIRLRGLPKQATLSAGNIIAPGSWAIPIMALQDLSVTPGDSGPSKYQLSFALLDIEGTVLAEAQMSFVTVAAARARPPVAARASQEPGATAAATQDGGASTPGNVAGQKLAAATPLSQGSETVVVGVAPTESRQGDRPAALAPKPTPAAPVTRPSVAALPQKRLPPAAEVLRPAPPAPKAPAMSPEARERALAFLDRGQRMLGQGDVASARLFFQRAADAGLASGALAMGASYDPVELAKVQAVGIIPDLDEARRWYMRARELGAVEAAARLDRINPR